jgi:hypothetical protein
VHEIGEFVEANEKQMTSHSQYWMIRELAQLSLGAKISVA